MLQMNLTFTFWHFISIAVNVSWTNICHSCIRVYQWRNKEVTLYCSSAFGTETSSDLAETGGTRSWFIKMYIYRFTQALRRGGCTVTPVKMYVTLLLCMKLAGVKSCHMWWHTHEMRFRMWRGDTHADIVMCWVVGLSALKWNCWALCWSSGKRDSRICLMPENCTSTNDCWQNLLSF